MICPICNTKYDQLAPQCPACGANLSALAKIAELPDYYYNEAIAAVSQKDWYAAIEALAATLVLRPTDVAALMLFGKVYVELHQLMRAAACFIKALKLEPRHREAQEALMWLKTNGCKIPLEEFMA